MGVFVLKGRDDRDGDEGEAEVDLLDLTGVRRTTMD